MHDSSRALRKNQEEKKVCDRMEGEERTMMHEFKGLQGEGEEGKENGGLHSVAQEQKNEVYM